MQLQIPNHEQELPTEIISEDHREVGILYSEAFQLPDSTPEQLDARNEHLAAVDELASEMLRDIVLSGELRQQAYEAVGQLADRIFLTDDETYTEDPAAIRQQVYEGIVAVNAEIKTTIMADRRQAIKQAFQAAQPNDTVLLTGIGNEDYRNMGGRKEPWDERVVAREELKLL